MLALLLALSLEAASPTGGPLAWVHDDWPQAKAAALRQHKLVAVDVWATWCHSCLSMRNYTLLEPPMRRAAGAHVYLSLEYDRPGNAAFFAKFPVGSFPTFLVIDPASETVVTRWLGTGTAEQMAGFFLDARRAAAAKTDPLAAAERALVKGENQEALAIIEPALAGKAGKISPADRQRLLDGYFEALAKTDRRVCAERGFERIDETDDSDQGLDAAATIANCASAVDPPLKTKLLEKVRDRLEAALKNPATAKLSVDDRSGIYSTLTDAYDDLGDTEHGAATAKLRLEMLDAAAEKAKTPEERATFDAHRLECDLRLEHFVAAEKMLGESELAMPNDYNPPARLALLYLKSERPEDGLRAIDRALKLGYGPRRLRLFLTKIDLAAAAKDFALARLTIADARSYIEKLDPGLVKPEFARTLNQKSEQLAKLEDTKQ
jgi:hypothetical protein